MIRFLVLLVNVIDGVPGEGGGFGGAELVILAAAYLAGAGFWLYVTLTGSEWMYRSVQIVLPR